MSFEDDTSTELKDFFSSKIDKLFNSKLDRLDKLDQVFEAVTLLRSENTDLRLQNTLLTQQVAHLNTSLQEFCQKAASELKELREGQINLQKIIDEEIPNKKVSKRRTENATDKSSKPKDYRNSTTDMDNPDRVLTPPDPTQSDVSVTKAL